MRQRRVPTTDVTVEIGAGVHTTVPIRRGRE